MTRISIVGTVGIPARYGGFETLAENLVFHNQSVEKPFDITVYCSGRTSIERPSEHLGADLRYVPLRGNGVQSVLYDFWCLISAVRRRADLILLLGHGGSFSIPVLRLFSRTKFVTNIDGVEWRRAKWSRLARWFLRNSEAFAVRYSHAVIADNRAILDHVRETFGKDCQVIAYGGDHALNAPPKEPEGLDLPPSYAFALCRIEPENNVAMILDAFARRPEKPLLFVGNWEANEYGRSLRAAHTGHTNIRMIDSIYDLGVLRTLRERADLYVHGHSAGGTNPSLVEAMHFGMPILAFDCAFNRHSTEDRALYFASADDLAETITDIDPTWAAEVGAAMIEIARRLYTWGEIGDRYFELFADVLGQTTGQGDEA